MIVTKKEPSMAPYARKEAYEYENTHYEADIQNGDTVTIKNPGEMVTGQFGEQYEFLIETRNGNRLANFNQSSVNILHDSFGEDTQAWVGKEVHVLTKKGMFGGKKAIAAYFVTDGWSLDEYGDLVKGVQTTPPAPAPQEKTEGQKQAEELRNQEPGEMPF